VTFTGFCKRTTHSSLSLSLYLSILYPCLFLYFNCYITSLHMNHSREEADGLKKEGCYTNTHIPTTKSPQPDVECHIRFFFFFLSTSSLHLPSPPTSGHHSSPSPADPAGERLDPGQPTGKGPDPRLFWPGNGQIPAVLVGKGPDPVQLRLSPSPSLFAVADRKRKEEE
jgi:hypothetical protein